MLKLLRRLHYWLTRDRAADGLAAELEAHRALSQDALERSGMSPSDAAKASRRALGNVSLAREDARAIWIWPALERVWQDVRYGVRILRANPSFSAVAMVTLALGIGTSTAVFSVVEAELWRPLPFPEPAQLTAVYRTSRTSNVGGASTSDFLEWRSESRSFESLAAFRWNESHILRAQGASEPVTATPVTPNFLATLRVPIVRGRDLSRDDDHASRDRAVIVTDASWRRLFASDPAVIGTTIFLDDMPYQIVGITPEESRLEFISEPDFFVPLTLDLAGSDSPAQPFLNVIGRLNPGVSLASADAELNAIVVRLAQRDPAAADGVGARVEDLCQAYTGFNWRTLIFFLAAAFLVLLVSCINVGNLLLVRALGRQREFALRTALGSGLGALVRQLLIEGATLSLPAGAVGILLASWSTSVLLSLLPNGYLSRGGHVGLDARVCAFAVAVSCLTALAFGLAPILFARRLNLNATLAHSGRSVAGHAGHQRLRSVLIVAEIALALVLLFGAGLFVRSFSRLTEMPLGFDPHDRLTMRLLLKGPAYADPRRVIQFYEDVVARVRAQPGVRTAVAASSTPLRSTSGMTFLLADRAVPNHGDEPHSLVRVVTPGYFRALDIRLTTGRDFSSADIRSAPRVAIVNEHLARRYFPSESPIGRPLTLVPGPSTPYVSPGPVEIIGIAHDTKEVGFNEIAFDDIYLPFAQAPASSMFLIASTDVAATTMAEPIRQAVLQLDKNLPVYGVSTMELRATESLQSDRFNLIVIGIFAGLAVLLAGIGIYGAMSYAMQQRTREFGVRMALGSPRRRILTLAIGQSARLGLAGLTIGAAVSLMLARLFGSSLYLVQGQHEGLIYGVSVFDPMTLTSASSLVFAIALLAGCVPARRAALVDPVKALQHS